MAECVRVRVTKFPRLPRIEFNRPRDVIRFNSFAFIESSYRKIDYQPHQQEINFIGDTR